MQLAIVAALMMSPFGVTPTVENGQARIAFEVPAGHFLYADKLSV